MVVAETWFSCTCFSPQIFHIFSHINMPVKAIPKVSTSRNGLGAFVRPCNRIQIQYCNWGGSSSGVRELLSSGKLNTLAGEKPDIFFEVVKKAGPPKITFHYAHNKVREVEAKNMDVKLVTRAIDELSQASGNKLFKWNHKVISENESVRGIWSPLHLPKDNRHRI